MRFNEIPVGHLNWCISFFPASNVKGQRNPDKLPGQIPFLPSRDEQHENPLEAAGFFERLPSA